jgi:hypothetical protein
VGVKEFTSVVAAAAAELHTKLWVEAGSQMQHCKQECFNCHCMMCDMPCPHWRQCVFVHDLITIGKQRWNWVWTASCHVLRCAWNQGLLEPLSSSNIFQALNLKKWAMVFNWGKERESAQGKEILNITLWSKELLVLGITIRPSCDLLVIDLCHKWTATVSVTHQQFD